MPRADQQRRPATACRPERPVDDPCPTACVPPIRSSPARPLRTGRTVYGAQPRVGGSESSTAWPGVHACAQAGCPAYLIHNRRQTGTRHPNRLCNVTVRPYLPEPGAAVGRIRCVWPLLRQVPQTQCRRSQQRYAAVTIQRLRIRAVHSCPFASGAPRAEDLSPTPRRMRQLRPCSNKTTRTSVHTRRWYCTWRCAQAGRPVRPVRRARTRRRRLPRPHRWLSSDYLLFVSLGEGSGTDAASVSEEGGAGPTRSRNDPGTRCAH